MIDFVEPAASPSIISFMQGIYPLYLRAKLGRFQIEISDDVKEALAGLKGKSTVICPNHSNADDADALFGLSSAIHEQFYFLTARELFGPAHSFKWKALQKLGCYSVERSIADLHAVRATINLLCQGQNKIVIFPEGEVSHQNEHLMALENGAELLSLHALNEAKAIDSQRTIYILPLAMVYCYSNDIRPLLASVMMRLESKLGIRSNALKASKSRIKEIYLSLVSRLEKAHAIESNGKTLGERLFVLRKQLILEVQEWLAVSLPDHINQLTQIHILKNIFTASRWGEGDALPDATARKYYHQLRLATDLVAIGDHSFNHYLSQEDTSELLGIVEQEVYRTTSFRRLDKKVLFAAADPIDVSEYLVLFQSHKKQGIEALKRELSERLSARMLRLEKSQQWRTIDD